nr:cuticle protein 7-like [Procambarus clarkii]
MTFRKVILIIGRSTTLVEHFVPWMESLGHIMKVQKVILAVMLVAAAMAAPSLPSYGYSPALSYRPLPAYEGPARYNFQWAVNDGPSGNDFGHQEARDGDNTKGSYYVQLPDGRLQTVNYFVDGDSGYVADVQYQGEARFPSLHSSYRPTPAYNIAPLYRPTPVYG